MNNEDSGSLGGGGGTRLFSRLASLGKVALVGLLALVLLIPLAMIRGVLGERQGRYYEAVREVTATWGGRQEIAGPVLVVPYSFRQTVVKAGRDGKPVSVEEDAVGYAHFLPDELEIEGQLDSSRLHRGIYEAVVFGAQVFLKGSFPRPPCEVFGVKRDRDVHWDKAFITIAVSDMRGTREEVRINLGGKACRVEPGCSLQGAASGVTARPDWKGLEEVPLEFDIALSLNGSGGIRFAPLGKKTVAGVSSQWQDPSFQGDILPSKRELGKEGFNATWEVSYYGRSYPQFWGVPSSSSVDHQDMVNSAFGVDLLDLVDSYRLVERSIKYGLLFLVLVFTAFFLFEVLSSIKVHPFQYILIGAALCLFYLALLSLSEIIAFAAAYGAGALVSSLMIGIYSAKILRCRSRGIKVFAGLSAVYGILYVILCQQDYSLLYGTIGLFAALALVMYVTRNVDWYSKDRNQ